MSTVISISTRRRYGVARVCRVWGVARAGVYRRRGAAEAPPAPRRRPGPQGPMSDAALVEAIRRVLTNSPFHGEGYRKVWARLRHAGLRTSKERVRRLMRENGLQAATRTGRPRGPRNHDGRIVPEVVDAMWGTDMTAAFTVEHGHVAVFVAIDHCSAECVGIHAALHGTRHEALEPIRQGVTEHFGGVEKDAASGLSIRHDHGSQYMSRDFQREIAWLGAASSPAFVRAPEGNGCAERFIRTLKENLLWVRTFRTVEQLRKARGLHVIGD
jgi:putative transposase